MAGEKPGQKPDGESGLLRRLPCALTRVNVRWLATGASAAALAAAAPAALAQAAFNPLDLPELLASHSAASLSIFLVLSVFSLVTSFLYVREREKWNGQASAYEREIVRLRQDADRAQLLFAGDVQILATWQAATDEPVIEGDHNALTGANSPRRVLAFGTWLPPADARQMEEDLTRLRHAGEPFTRLMRGINGRYIEAVGRVVAGRAMMRIRDVGEERRHRLEAEAKFAHLYAEHEQICDALDHFPQPIWLRGENRRLKWVNQAYARAVEAQSPADALEREAELLDHRQRTEVEARIAQTVAFSGRLPAVIGGARAAVDVFETPCKHGAAGIATDMSELESVRADLERQMKAHVLTLDQLPTGVVIFDKDQRLVFHNVAYRLLWSIDPAFLASGPTESELLDRLRAEHKIPEPDDFRKWKSEWLDGYRRLEPRRLSWFLPDGRSVNIFATPNPQGGLTYLFDDFTAANQLETQFNAMLRVQGETLDMLQEGVAVFGSDGRMRLSNPAFAKFWKIPEAVMKLSPHIDEIVRIAMISAPEDPLWSDLAGVVSGVSDRRTGFSGRIQRRDDTVLEHNVAPLPDGGTLVTLSDASASFRVERALRERNDALQNAAAIRNEFVQGVSYSLRSPLTTIIGFAQLLDDGIGGPLTTKQHEYSQHIIRSSAALLVLIDNILDLASVDAGEIALDLAPCNLMEDISKVVSGIDDQLASAQVRLRTEISGSLQPFLADSRRIRTAVYSLLSNAIAFSPPGETVTLSAMERDNILTITVVDRGPGIPADLQKKIFQPFESHVSGERHRGVGVGLSIVKAFAELHGGAVELVSALGVGTTVNFRIPYRLPAPSAVPAPGQQRQA
ncbi:MAG: PAS-domain containing protein [Beijerinckiaceae bacterium]